FLEPWRRFVDSAGGKAEPSSARSVLPPSLLTCLYDFVHAPGWPNLENVAVLQGRMLRHELYSMIHVPRLKAEYYADLFLGFRIGAVRGCDCAVLPVQGQGRLRRLKRFSTSPVPVGAKMVVVIKACVEHGVSFGISHAIKSAFVVIPQTNVFHCSSPHSGLPEPAAERCAASFISSLRCVFRGRSGKVVYLRPLGPCSGAG